MPSKTFDDYADDLKPLIEAAHSAIESGVRTKMIKARDALIAFVEASNDLVAGVTELDDIAVSARRDVSLALLDSSLNTDIGSRNDEVARLVKKFSTQSAVNNSAASDLKLERARALTDASLVAVNEFKKFAETVDSGTPDGKRLAKAIQDAIDAVTALTGKVGS